MKEKIIAKANSLFLSLGFKSITMDDIARELCISKKTIYKYFCNKEALIGESTSVFHDQIHEGINRIIDKNHNAIEENFEIRRMFKEMFQSSDNSPIYQLKRHYPQIFEQVISREVEECNTLFRNNIERGIQQGLYRKEINIATYSHFYYILIFGIKESTPLEKEATKLEFEALEYHTRAMSTAKGIQELENQLTKLNTY